MLGTPYHYKDWIAGAYDATAKARGDARWKEAAAELEKIEQRALSMGGTRRGDRVLELGCGNGSLTAKLAATVGADGHLKVVDLSSSMLAEARRRVDGQTPVVEFLCGDFDSLDFGEAAFHGIYSKWAIELSCDVGALLGRLSRALMPSGRLVVAVVGDPSRSTVSRSAAFLRKTFFDHQDMSSAPPDAFALATKERMMAACTKAGLRRLTIVPHTTRITFASSDELIAWLCETQGPIRGLLEHLRSDARAGARNGLSQFLALPPSGEVVATQQSILLLGQKC